MDRSPERSERRRFLKVLQGSAAAAIGILSYRGALSESSAATVRGLEIRREFPRVRVAQISQIKEKEPFHFTYPDQAAKQVILKLGKPARDGVGPESDIVGYSTACPHMGCDLGNAFEQVDSMLGPCSCHFSCFDLLSSGELIQGQATEALPQVILESDGDSIFAIGIKGLIYGRFDNLG